MRCLPFFHKYELQTPRVFSFSNHGLSMKFLVSERVCRKCGHSKTLQVECPDWLAEAPPLTCCAFGPDFACCGLEAGHSGNHAERRRHNGQLENEWSAP
jgi:hypothetical protein